MFAQDPSCECVQKWGWRGPDCNTDVDECSLEEGDAIAAVLDIVPPYGGCGEGDMSSEYTSNLQVLVHAYYGLWSLIRKDAPGSMVLWAFVCLCLG